MLSVDFDGVVANAPVRGKGFVRVMVIAHDEHGEPLLAYVIAVGAAEEPVAALKKGDYVSLAGKASLAIDKDPAKCGLRVTAHRVLWTAPS